MIILGIDPGYAIVGCGIVEYNGNKFKTLGQEAITTSAQTEFVDRLKIIYNRISYLVNYYSPDAVAVEKLFFNNNHKTAIDVSQARGVILLAATQHNIPIYEYTPLQVKQSVVGYGRAVKAQVMEMTRVLLGLVTVPKPDDVADALAIAICHGHNSNSLVNMKKLSMIK